MTKDKQEHVKLKDRLLVQRYAYHDKRSKGADYDGGYCMGVELYQQYDDCDADGKKATKGFFDDMRKCAAKGVDFAKGVMSGLGDAAKERKKYRKR